MKATESQKRAMKKYWHKIYPLRKEEFAKKRKIRLIEINNKIAELFGTVKCIICESQKDIDIHEIYGKKHPRNNPLIKYKYFLKHKKDFVVLCSKHHYLIHRFAKRLRREPKTREIIRLIILLLEENS